jgi:hypothetical protein
MGTGNNSPEFSDERYYELLWSNHQKAFQENLRILDTFLRNGMLDDSSYEKLVAHQRKVHRMLTDAVIATQSKAELDALLLELEIKKPG